MGPEDVVINAAGSMPGDLQCLWRASTPMQYHVEYAFSCMGYEIPAAIGVKLALGDAHEVVAHAVKDAIAAGVDLSELPLDKLQAYNPAIEQDVYEVLSLRGSLNARNILGGTAPEQVRAQVARHRARLG